ncbi:DNA-directed DNA polymerase [Tanacetum coccineum]
MQEVILFYNRLVVQTRQILDSKGAIPSKTTIDAKVAIQEMAKYSQKWQNGTFRTRSTETSDGLAAIQAQLNNFEREIKKVNEKVYVAQVGCEQCKGPHYTKDYPLKEEGGYKVAASGFYQRNNAKPSYQERKQSREETMSKFMSESMKRHEENSNMIKEIRASTDVAVLQEIGFGSLPSSTKANPRHHVKSISTTSEDDSNPIRHIGSPQYAISTPQNRRFMFESRQMIILFPSRLNNYYCEEKKGSYRPQFSEAYSYEASHIDKSIPRKEKDHGFTFTLLSIIVGIDNALLTLGHTTVKYPKGIVENVLVGIGKFVFPIDFIILDMPEDVKIPLILGRPFLSIAHAKIDVFKRKITLRVGDEKIIFKSVKPASSLIKMVYMLSLRERMELDLEARLMGETLVEFYNSIIKDKVELKGKNVVGAFMNVPIFVGNFSVVTRFVVVENEIKTWEILFLENHSAKLHVLKQKRFDGLITIHNGSDNVTYQMARSHPRFKHLSNASATRSSRY